MDWGRAIRISASWFAVGCAAFLAVLVAGQYGYGKAFVSDTGIVQVTTAALLIAGSLWSGWLAWKSPEQRVNLGLLAYIMAIYAGRECDLHKSSYLAERITRLQFYLLPNVPFWQKVCFASVLMSASIAMVMFLFRTLPSLLRDLKQKQGWTLFVVLWFVCLLFAQLSDQSSLNYTLPGQAFEEVLEGTAAGFAFLVVSYFPRAAKQLNEPQAQSGRRLAA